MYPWYYWCTVQCRVLRLICLISVCGWCVQDLGFQLVPPVPSTQASEYCCAHISGSWNFPLGSDGGAVVKTEDGNFAIWVSGSVNRQWRWIKLLLTILGYLASLLLIHVLVCLPWEFAQVYQNIVYSPAAMCYPGLNILYIFGGLHNIMCIVCSIVYMIAIRIYPLKYGRLIH